MKSSRMRAKTNNAKTATKQLVAMTRAPHAEGQALRAQWLVPPLAGRPGRIVRYGAMRSAIPVGETKILRPALANGRGEGVQPETYRASGCVAEPIARALLTA